MVYTPAIMAATEEAAGIAALGIDPWAILIQGFTFLVFVLVVKKFAFTKVVDTLEKRRVSIEDSLDQAEELQKQNQEAEKRVNQLLHEARLEAETVIAKGNQEAASIIKEAQDAATVKAEKIIADGKAQIEQQVVKAQEQLKKETLALVAQATATLLGETVDAKKNEKLIQKALAQAAKEKK